VFGEFKTFADDKKEVLDADIEALVVSGRSATELQPVWWRATRSRTAEG